MYYSSIEILESRIAPATFVDASTITFFDFDGDVVTVKTSSGSFDAAFTHFTFVPPDVTTPQRLELLALSPDFLGANLSITARRAGGDGQVDVGAIEGAVDLGKVVVRGDLGAITAGAIKELNVHSMGRHGNAALVSQIDGALGAFIAKTDVRDVEIKVAGDLGKLSIGGSFLGGDADFAGNLVVTGNIGSVKIGHDVQGGGGASTGQIQAGGKIGPVTIGGSLRGGGGDSSGRIASDVEIGGVKINGSLRGAGGASSGEISSGGSLGEVSIGGALAGGAGESSGRIAAVGDVAGVTVGGDVTGGTAENSGVIQSAGTIKNVTVGGSLIGGPASSTGMIFAGKDIGSVNIAGNLIGGNSEVDGLDVQSTGAIRAEQLASVTIGGSVFPGAVLSATGTLTASGSIFAAQDIGSLVVKGNPVKSARLDVSVSDRDQAGLVADALAGLTVQDVTLAGAFNGTLGRAIIDAGIAGNVGLLGELGGLDNVISSISSIIINGQTLGTAEGGGQFGFLAEQISSPKIGPSAITLAVGAGAVPIGMTGDLALRQI